MKIITSVLILFLLFIAGFCAFGQSKTLITGQNLALTPLPGIPAQIVTGQSVRVATTVDVALVNGLVGSINYPADSSKLLNFIVPKGEQWKVVYTATKIGTPPPTGAQMIEAETGTITGATVDASTAGKTVCCIIPGAVLKYSDVITGKTKLTIRYSRGNTGTGSVTLQIGTGAIITLSFPYTGSWTTFKDVSFTVAGSGTGFQIKSASVGPANFESYTFE